MKLPKPFLGRALIEAINEDVMGYMEEKMGVSKELKAMGFQLPETVKKGTVPLKKGIILETAPDWYGEKFQTSNGTDVGETPDVGDIVWFVPNETFAIDVDRKYHLLNDCDVVAYERGKENV
jgi:hypothetical protein